MKKLSKWQESKKKSYGTAAPYRSRIDESGDEVATIWTGLSIGNFIMRTGPYLFAEYTIVEAVPNGIDPIIHREVFACGIGSEGFAGCKVKATEAADKKLIELGYELE